MQVMYTAFFCYLYLNVVYIFSLFVHNLLYVDLKLYTLFQYPVYNSLYN